MGELVLASPKGLGRDILTRAWESIGPQPFRRDYWGIADKNAAQIDGTHRTDWLLWKYIDPHIDFYIASIYVFYERPEVHLLHGRECRRELHSHPRTRQQACLCI